MMVTYDKSGKVLSAKLKGKKIDPKKMYKVATIDYLANGGDYMVPLTRAKRLYEDEQKYGIHVLNYVKELTAAGKQIKSVNEQRMQCK
jgi:2',3'-cyclic-nucleotide 2'-phosphodiesterase (5'-nucleotidase family)